MLALADGHQSQHEPQQKRPTAAIGYPNPNANSWTNQNQCPGSVNSTNPLAAQRSGRHQQDSSEPDSDADADNILDVIPEPLPLNRGGGEMGPAAEVLANLHMRLLGFLAWDRSRGLRYVCVCACVTR